MAYPVKWYQSTMEGAPAAADSTVGGMYAVLKACLVTGFNNKTVTSMAYDSVAKLITITIAAGHGYLKNQIVAVAGANEAEFNGEFRVLSVTGTTLVVSPDTAPTVSAATGTITIKTPGLGWALYSDDPANYTAIFKRVVNGATTAMLYINNSAWTGWNTNGWYAKASMVDNVTRATTYDTVVAGTFAATHNYSSVKKWDLVGDPLLFYLAWYFGNNTYDNLPDIYIFGDINTIKPGDCYHTIFSHVIPGCSLGGWQSSGYTRQNAFAKSGLPISTSYYYMRLARAYHQLPGPVLAYHLTWAGQLGYGLPYPNPVDYKLYYQGGKLPVMEPAGLRGWFPGASNPLYTYAGMRSSVMPDLLELGSLHFCMACSCDVNAPSGNYDYSRMFLLDLKNSWR